jgi:adenosylcobinamide kinase/adenosylcobinamide-phosphate guanylyltransferase
MLELILGGARSGKSSLAVARARASGRPVAFIVTATASDDEMRKRIAKHRSERPAAWTTLEAPVELAAALRELGQRDVFIVVDCLTLWIANVLFRAAGESFELDEPGWARRRAGLIEALSQYRGDAVLVSNEVGLGIVPESMPARRFRDEQGRLNQELAVLCDRVTFVAAGLPLSLK